VTYKSDQDLCLMHYKVSQFQRQLEDLYRVAQKSKPPPIFQNRIKDYHRD